MSSTKSLASTSLRLAKAKQENWEIIRVRIGSYNHAHIKSIIRRATSEFGYLNLNKTWQFSPTEESDYWYLDFAFKSSNDAIIFALKHCAN